MFQRAWFPIVEVAQVPPMVSMVRAWDLAGTVKDEKKGNDPDYTAGVLMGRTAEGTFYVLDVKRLRGTPQQVQALVRQTAESDGDGVHIHMEQEPGSAGKFVVGEFLRLLAGYVFGGERSTGSKADRALPFAAQAEGGAVKLVRGPWNRDYLDELEVFPFGRHDDQVDATSAAFAKLVDGVYPFLPETHPLPRTIVAAGAAAGVWSPDPDDRIISPYLPHDDPDDQDDFRFPRF